MPASSLQPSPPSPAVAGRRDWPWIGALALLLAALHAPVLCGGMVYFHDDLWAWFLPVHDYLRHELWAGNRLPWCPLVSCGYPLAAEPQTGVWYPLNLLLAVPLPIGQALGWLLWLHYVLAGAGVFALARRLGSGRLSAFCSAAVFTTTGFMIAHLHHVAIVTAASWLPWAWYALWSYRHPAARDAGGTRYLLLLAWCSAAQLLAGQPQVWLLTFASGFALLALAEVILPVAAPPLRRGVIGRRWLLLLLSTLCGVGLAGVTILPMLSLYRLSARSEPSLDFVTSYALSKEALKTFMGLRLQVGDAWEYEGFAGLTTLALALFALLRGRNRPLLNLLAALILLALFMGLAGVNPLYRLFVHLPLLSGLRCAARWLLVISACLALLAAHGLTALGPRRWLQWPLAALLVAETAWFGMHYNPQTLPGLLDPPAQARLLGGGRVLSTTAHALPQEFSPEDQLQVGRELVVPNLNLKWGIATADGYMPLQLAHFQEFKGRANWLKPAVSRSCGIRWLLTPSGRPSAEGSVLRQETATVRVYEREAWRGWLAESVRAEGFTAARGTGLGSVGAVKESSRGVVAECEAVRPCYLVLPYTWLPWWQTKVNGVAAQAQRAEIAFTAVAVPQGKSTVELRFVQPRWRLGVAVSLASALLLGLVAAAGRRRRRGGD